MLVLSRQKNESVMIGDEITVVVVDIRGDKVRLGFAAPPECRIHRQEVYDAINKRQELAVIPDEALAAFEASRPRIREIISILDELSGYASNNARDEILSLIFGLRSVCSHMDRLAIKAAGATDIKKGGVA